MAQETLYQRLKATGAYMDHHESDLYVEVNDQTKAILGDYPLERGNSKMFCNQVTGKMCYDVPFAYDPFWKELG